VEDCERETLKAKTVGRKVRRKDTNVIVSASKFYIKREYYSIKAVTPEEDDGKKVF